MQNNHADALDWNGRGYIMTKKNIAIISNIVLMIWFFLDMIGVSFDQNVLVTRSYKEDGVFLILFVIVFVWFLFKERIGKYMLSAWLMMWLVMQFIFHWVFTIFGPWEGKINYFADTIKLIPSEVVYVPDLYHIILHLLILTALISLIIYIRFIRSKK